MKKMISGLSVLIAAVILTLSLCSFHGSRSLDPFVMPEGLDESKTYEITFWAKNDTNKTQTNIYNKAISDFEALYPNIKVNIRLYTDYNRLYNDIITNIATQTTPNVAITYPDHIATYLTGMNVVVPLDELMDDGKYGLGGSLLKFDGPRKEEIVPSFLNECILGGAHYALPYMRSTEACYINKTYVERLGYTVPDVLSWDYIWEVSEAAMEKNADGTFKVNGQNVLIPFIYKSTDNMMIQMLKQKDAGYSDADGGIFIFNDTTKSILETVHEHTETGAFSTFKISSYPGNFFNVGQCIFAIDSTAGATWLGTTAPLMEIKRKDVAVFDTVVRMIPQFDASSPDMISQGPSMCLFNKKDSGEVLASWLFMQFMLTNEVQIAYSSTEGYIPVTTKALDSPEYKDYLSKRGIDNDEHYYVKIDAAQLLIDNIANTFVTPVFNGSASLRNAAGQLIEDTAIATRRKQKVNDEFYETLYSNVTSLYRLNQLGASTGNEKADLGPLPTQSVVLLGAVAFVWLILGTVFIIRKMRSKKRV